MGFTMRLLVELVFVGRMVVVGVLAGMIVWVGMAVDCSGAGDAASVGGTELAVA